MNKIDIIYVIMLVGGPIAGILGIVALGAIEGMFGGPAPPGDRYADQLAPCRPKNDN